MRNQPDQSPSSRACVAILLIALVLSPMLYLISFGPICGLAQRGYLPEGPVYWFYHPVKMLHDAAGPPVSTMLQQYLAIFD